MRVQRIDVFLIVFRIGCLSRLPIQQASINLNHKSRRIGINSGVALRALLLRDLWLPMFFACIFRRERADNQRNTGKNRKSKGIV